MGDSTDGFTRPPDQSEPGATGEPKNVRAIVRTVARAHGWQVLTADEIEDTYSLPGAPAKKIRLQWALGGHVLLAYGGGGVKNWLTRFDGYPDHLAKTESVLRALAGRTDVFPAPSSLDAAVRYVISPSLLLPPAPAVPMRWYARPEGESWELSAKPRLASWEKADNPAQVCLQAYLDDTEALLADSRIDGPWALRLDVGLPPARDLLNLADLDNYAYPLARRLQDSGLVSVWCTKQHAEHSFVRIEPAKEVIQPPTDVLIAPTTASASTLAFKEQVYTAVAGAAELPPGPVRLELAFVVDPRTNWLNLWKQTIDSLDPILGRTTSDRDWHPLDGRITELGMHLTVDSTLGYNRVIGIAASPARRAGSMEEIA
ncbi:hypothetical protein [Mycobacterium sp. GA-1285]|uniref:hypothetical protein n=1 Tax=Mycobacterium sp. GA-1285 TaxID=1772282 RepID=UPI0020A24DA8|nr:hypothetical protein [Mycobacterium sp. GA-1285]